MVRSLTVLTCLAAFVGGGAWAREQPSPRLQGDSLPVPPQQSAPWTPPKTRLSSRLVAAARTLFAQGLADPRGCEYRQIETRGCDEQGNEDGVVKSHGWVLPADPARPQRFAVRWDGLVYPLLKIGPAADLRADLQPIENREGALIGVCLLLRLEEGPLAEKYFDSIAASDPHWTSDAGWPYEPYLPLAREWTWSLFRRAAEAQMRGDDHLALLTARALVSIWQAVEAEAEDLDIPRPQPDRHGGDAAEESPASDELPLYLENLKPIRELLADQERRAAERKQKKAAPLHLDQLDYFSSECQVPFPAAADFWKEVEGKLGRRLGGAQRVALVIRWLEELGRLQGDSLVAAIKPYRDEAIEPLLDCLQNDRRLTRGGEFGQYSDFTLQRVDEIAYEMLCSLLETRFDPSPNDVYSFETLAPEERAALVKRIRAHWQKTRNTSPARELHLDGAGGR
jgi:hypothetical protein